jgi:hypothetical protein
MLNVLANVLGTYVEIMLVVTPIICVICLLLYLTRPRRAKRNAQL